MEVEFIFKGLGINDNNQANILLYDEFNNLIYDGQTYNGILKICLNKTLYKLIVYLCNERIEKYIYINNNKYVFYFKRSIINNNSITLILTDYYYNLPIEKGELIIWQK